MQDVTAGFWQGILARAFAVSTIMGVALRFHTVGWLLLLVAAAVAIYRLKVFCDQRRNPPPLIRIRPGRCDSAENLAAYLREKVYGQPMAADQVSRVLWSRLKSDLNKAPLGVFCFAGAKGSGRSHFALMLNQRLFDQETGPFTEPLTFDMNQYRSPFEAMNLLGSSVHSHMGLLPGRLKEQPNTLVVLENFDRLQEETQKLFISAFKEGFFTDFSTRGKISTTRAIFILTVDADDERMIQLAREGRNFEAISTDATRLLSRTITPDVLDCIDATIPFAPLSGRDLGKVIVDQLEGIAGRMRIPIPHGGLDLQVVTRLAAASMEERQSIYAIRRMLETKFTHQLQSLKDQGAQAAQFFYDKTRDEIMVYPADSLGGNRASSGQTLRQPPALPGRATTAPNLGQT